MNEIITAVLLVLGSLFSFVAALGMLRLPDTVIRMHAATKAGTLGAGLILIGEAFFYADFGITVITSYSIHYTKLYDQVKIDIYTNLLKNRINRCC